MLFKTADWDDSAGTHNALATETAFLSYSIVHEFNRPAKATVVLKDPTGSIMQKYDVDPANDSVYIGPGRAYIEDPDATCIFDGRIVRAIGDMETHRVTLECEDWLSQLDDDRLDYDMREDLGSNLRQSEIHTDPDSTVFVGPAYLNLAALAGFVTKDSDEEVDDTVDANDADASDVGMLSKIGKALVLGNSANFGFTNRVGDVRCNIGMAGTGNYTLVWYYSKGADAWGILTVTDGTTSFKTAGTHDVTWTPPSDWATDEVGGITCLWVRATLATGGAPWTEARGTQFWAIENYVWDDDLSWAANAHNDKYLVLGGAMAGTITVGTGPYDGTATGADAYSDDPHITWVDDNTTDLISDNDSDYTLDYDFRVYVGHNTPSDLYVHDSISAARVILTYLVTGDCTCKLQIDDKTNGWIDLDNLDIGFGRSKRLTIAVPTEYLDNIISSAGIATVRFAVTWGSGAASVSVKYIRLEVDVETTVYSTAMKIYDTLTNQLLTDTDLSVSTAATCIWEGCQYAIGRPIYKHIDTAESGTLVSGGDVIYAMTAAANVEHTTGISTRHFIERTRLEILQDLATEDSAVFYIPLGDVALTWKSTFNNGAPTAMTDVSVLSWQSDWNYPSMFNEYHVQGARIGDHQISAEDSDATSITTYGISRTKVVKHSGVLSDRDCTAMADRLVTANKDVQLYLQAELKGLSALRLGSEVSITSTYLGLTAQVYMVTHWAYDSRAYRTSIRLQPRASTTGYQENVSLAQVRTVFESQKGTQGDKYVPDLHTQEWA